MRADALSTALSLLPLEDAPSLLAAVPAEAIFVTTDGRQVRLSS